MDSQTLKIDFSSNEAPIKNLFGFSGIEKWGRWIDGNKAFFTIKKEIKTPSVIFLKLRIFSPPQKKIFEIIVKVNGFLVKKLTCSSASEEYLKLSIPIRNDFLIKSNELEVSFEVDKPESPFNLNISSDKRVLSIGLKELYLYENISETFLIDLVESNKSLEDNSSNAFVNNVYNVSPEARLMLRNKLGLINRLPKKDYFFWQENHKKTLNKLIHCREESKIKVFFLVNLANTFPSRPVFELMLDSEFFEPSILVVPFMSVLEKNRYQVCKENFELLKTQYKNVFCAWDFDKKQLLDYKNEMDIIFLPSSAIDNQPHNYRIFDFLYSDILTVFIDYTYLVQLAGGIENCEFLNLVWKNYTPTKSHQLGFIDKQDIEGSNSIVAGYPKMDKYVGSKKNKERKLIIIAPHHSIHQIGLRGQFLTYYEFFSQLPDLFQDVDFVFRPHPFLEQHLVARWGQDNFDKYWDLIRSKKNAIYDEKDEYSDLFINSDGIIHDCGSFIPEYLYTENPPCFILDKTVEEKNVFNDFGIKCLNFYYKAYNEIDILNYIKSVVLDGNDYMRDERLEFAGENVKVKHPSSSNFIIDDLLKHLCLI